MSQRQFNIHPVPGLWPLTWPMGLTLLRLLLLPVFLSLVLAGSEGHAGLHPSRWWAVVIFGVMAATDKLDGYLARKLNQTTKIGTLLDPVADKLLVACSVILLSFEWVASEPFRIPLPVVVLIYASYLLIAVGALALLVLVGRVTIAPRPLGKLNTFLQLTLVMLTLVAPAMPVGDVHWISPTLRVLWWSVPVVVLATCGDYAMQGISQFRAARRERKVGYKADGFGVAIKAGMPRK